MKQAVLEGFTEAVEALPVPRGAAARALVDGLMARFGEAVLANTGDVLRSDAGRAFAARYVEEHALIREYALCLPVLRAMRDMPFEREHLLGEAAEHALSASDPALAAHFAERCLIEEDYQPIAYGRAFAEKWCAHPGARELLSPAVGAWVDRLLAFEDASYEATETAPIETERCQPADFWGDRRVKLPGYLRHHLFAFDRERVLATVEDPPLNPIEYWSSPDWEDPTKFPFPEGGTSLLNLLEILIGCGHVDWLAGELSHREPRVAVVAALTRHPTLMRAAARVLEVPTLEDLIGRIAKRRLLMRDVVALADAGQAHPRFLTALADAIRRYSLTVDSGDALLEPIAYFKGLSKAEPGRLSHFFARRREAYPLLDHLWRAWAAGKRKAFEGTTPSGSMLYTTPHHIRTAAVGTALALSSDPSRLAELAAILRRSDGYGYVQSGSADGFARDTRKMVEQVLTDGGRGDLVKKLKA